MQSPPTVIAVIRLRDYDTERMELEFLLFICAIFHTWIWFLKVLFKMERVKPGTDPDLPQPPVGWKSEFNMGPRVFVLFFLIAYFYWCNLPFQVWGGLPFTGLFFALKLKKQRWVSEKGGTVQLVLNVCSSLGPFLVFLLLIISWFFTFFNQHLRLRDGRQILLLIFWCWGSLRSHL